MVIFIFGQNSYFIKQKISELIGEYKNENRNGLNFLKFDAQDFDFEEFKNKLETVPIFKEKKLIILSGLFKNKDFKEKFFNYLKTSSLLKDSDVILLIYEILSSDSSQNKALKKDKLFTQLTKKPILFKEYGNLNAKQLEKWVSELFKQEGQKISVSSLRLFLSLVPSNDLEYIKKEIDKLTLYAKSKNNANAIDDSDIEALISENSFQNVFQMLDYLGEKNKRAAIEIMHKLLKRGESELFLLSLITGQLRNLIKVKSLIEQNKSYQEIFRKLKIHPFVLQKLYGQARKFTLTDLKKAYFLIFETDLNIKTGKIDPGLAIDLLLSKI